MKPPAESPNKSRVFSSENEFISYQKRDVLSRENGARRDVFRASDATCFALSGVLSYGGRRAEGGVPLRRAGGNRGKWVPQDSTIVPCYLRFRLPDGPFGLMVTSD